MVLVVYGFPTKVHLSIALISIICFECSSPWQVHEAVKGETLAQKETMRAPEHRCRRYNLSGPGSTLRSPLLCGRR